MQRLQVDYFDGSSARAQPVEIWLDQGQLHLHSALLQRQYRQREVRWAERLRHGQRQTQLPDGGLLISADAGAWDAWASASGLGQPLAMRWAQHWGHVLLALLALVLLLFALWRWGLPVGSRVLSRHLPPALEQQIGAQTLAWLDEDWLRPSRLPLERQQALSQRLQAMLAGNPAAAGLPPWRLHCRLGRELLGPNAFALPGGDIVVTDALLELFEQQPDVVLGVLGHELGHLRHRHGMRLLLQTGAMTVIAGAIFGDYSTLLAGAPVLLAGRGYSRDFEREADAEAKALLLGAGLSPQLMIDFFKRLADYRRAHPDGGGVPPALASHPSDEERVRFFAEGASK
ncbi:M48 family metallopeptidase [Paucibacter sp. APW11]|uniref:M48 family metallopeptidase n=1 Tax=Roseateles aquae TaxID=3077235 RepID=A0ABU3PE60_9BURK|nr:M48 family metallopeptidase [Paucibacter sp. APW11]MDT9000859.1 M48 family metallopeptidase [Paucibacter sp. APW11]